MATSSPLTPIEDNIDLDSQENKRARIAQYATCEFIARCINQIKKKRPSVIQAPRAFEETLGTDKGYFNHIEFLFGPESPFLKEGDVDPYNLPNLQDTKIYPLWPPLHRDIPKPPHVGIIGAGMAGLYTGMILKSLGITYEIIEASDRIGGRVYTHRFTDSPGDYYDVGAMRFPDNPIMRRTFDLFRRLKIEKNPNPNSNEQKQGELIPYYLTGPGTPSYYNNRRVLATDPPVKDPFGASISEGGTVPDTYVAGGPDVIIGRILDEWREKYAKDPCGTWKELMSQKDSHAVSVRQEIFNELLLGNKNLSPADICYIANWCETMRSSTCTYDQAFVETLIHSLDFNYPVYNPAIDSEPASGESNIWWCLNGGADIVSKRMVEDVGEKTITTKTRVTAILEAKGHAGMEVLTDRSTKTKHFSHVIATTTASCLQVVDLKNASLSYAQKEALRVLRYNTAVKLGIKFREKWWIASGIKQGGQGKTDRPTRTVVYPSYALNDPETGEGVLLACYNSSMDAARLGGFVQGDDPTNQQLVLDIVLHDLAAMHKEPFEKLKGLVLSHHLHNWGNYKFTSGAWGEFGPGQFATLFGALRLPAAHGNLYFAGELTSIYHGWIVAALKSAYRAVLQMLWKEGQLGLIHQLQTEWGYDAEDTRNTTDWLVTLGMLAAELEI